MDVSIPRRAVSLLAHLLPVLTHRCSLRPVFFWPIREAPSGFDRDHRVDLAIVPRKIPFSVDNAVPSGSPPSYCNLPDVHAILACVEHTVSPGSKISTGYFPPVLIKSPSVRRSIMDYTERTIPFCTSQMGLTAEEPLYLQASETALSSRLITSLPSMQLQDRTSIHPMGCQPRAEWAHPFPRLDS